MRALLETYWRGVRQIQAEGVVPRSIGEAGGPWDKGHLSPLGLE
jgi:hypothetical protein